MRGLQIVCSPNRSTQEWPPTWCTKGSSITPFPGYGVPSACMRASRAGLILTPHWINELGGPTSVGRQEARPLVGPRSSGSALSVRTGALLSNCLEVNKGLTKEQRSRQNPLFPFSSLEEDRFYEPPFKRDTIRVFLMCHKIRYVQL